LTGRRRLNSPGFRGFIVPDAALLVALIGSLFPLVLIFDGVCGEREQGTLKLQLAGPLPRDTLLLAKIMAGLITLVVPMMVAWVGSVAYVVLQAGVTFSADEFGRLFAVAVLSALFVSVFFGLGLAASTWTRQSATALGVALLGWIALALVVPNAVPVFVRHFAPVPAASKLVLERKALKKEIWANDVPRWAQEVMEETGKRGWGDVWSSGLSRMVNEGETRAYDRLERQFHARLKHQTELTQMVSRVSPVALFIGCASDITGTGVSDYHRYLEGVDTHRRACGEARARMHEEVDQKYQRREARWGTLVYDPHGWPPFEVGGLRLGDVLAHCWVDIALLVGLAVMALLVALLAFVRYDVR
jgi:ABC-type transport system involved in multi-copper enzyme maturation permease subunit